MDNAGQKQNTVVIKESILDYDQLIKYRAQIAAAADSADAGGDVIIDFSNVRLMTTAAFAELIEIKAALLKQGHDLRSVGLHDQPKALCEVLKLCNLTRGREGNNEQGTT